MAIVELQAEKSKACKVLTIHDPQHFHMLDNVPNFCRKFFQAAKYYQDPFLHLDISHLNHHDIVHTGLSHAFNVSCLKDA